MYEFTKKVILLQVVLMINVFDFIGFMVYLGGICNHYKLKFNYILFQLRGKPRDLNLLLPAVSGDY